MRCFLFLCDLPLILEHWCKIIPAMIYLICVEKTGEMDQGRKYLLQDTTEIITIFVGNMESKGIAIAIFILKSVASKNGGN